MPLLLPPSAWTSGRRTLLRNLEGCVLMEKRSGDLTGPAWRCAHPGLEEQAPFSQAPAYDGSLLALLDTASTPSRILLLAEKAHSTTKLQANVDPRNLGLLNGVGRPSAFPDPGYPLPSCF